MTSKVDSEPVPTGIIVVELDDVVPRRHPDKPNLYVGATQLPLEDRYQFLERPEGKEWFRGHVVALRQDLSIPVHLVSPPERRALKRDTVSRLQRQGFTVNRDTYIWSVYVIELDPAAATDPGLGVLYVGETCRTPEERFAQHMSQAKTAKGGRLHSSIVARHGRRLRMDLAPTELAFDKESSKRAEAAWAEHLRTLGYAVKGAH